MTVFENFYTTSRAGYFRLSDGGGPFGFDISVAHQIDHLVSSCKVESIIETGTFVGDTLEYLGKQYPHLPVFGIELNPSYARIAGRRTRRLGNVTVLIGDSAKELPKLLSELGKPLVYLDAHWDADWPLAAELAAIDKGIIAVDDVDIGSDRFGFDQYGDIRLNAQLLQTLRPDLAWHFGHPGADYPHPCLQVGRRTGTAFAATDGEDRNALCHPWFTTATAMPSDG